MAVIKKMEHKRKIYLNLILLLLVSCSSNEEIIESIPEQLTIQERLDNGETPLGIFKSGVALTEIYASYYKGGYIFYLDTNSGKGMVTGKKNDFLGNIYWGGCSYSFQTSTELWTGKTNTELLNPYCLNPSLPNKNNPIKICKNIDRNGYKDWFLPSKSELLEMMINLARKDKEGFFFSNSLFWSSSNISFDLAWAVSLYGRDSSERYKNPSYESLSIGIRAIRYFDN